MNPPEYRNAGIQGARRAATGSRGAIWVSMAVLLLFVLQAVPPARAATHDSCVKCHSDSSFLVKNKKLYDYYRDWTLSVHSQEGITCDDCHGGNPKAASKKAAHGGQPMEAKVRSSPINFRNIPKTCARCHEEIYQRFRASSHFKHLIKNKSSEQAPNCVTCHGSVNSAVLNVRSVAGTCLQCHNKETDNHPEIPEKAESILNTFLSIHRFYRYITLRGDPNEVRSFFRLVDPMNEQLGQDWHRFDLKRIEIQTKDLLNLLKTKRNEIKTQQKKR